MFTNEDANRLEALEIAFEEAGGRGVDLANEIDALRAKRDGLLDFRIVIIGQIRAEDQEAAERCLVEEILPFEAIDQSNLTVLVATAEAVS